MDANTAYKPLYPIGRFPF